MSRDRTTGAPSNIGQCTSTKMLRPVADLYLYLDRSLVVADLDTPGLERRKRLKIRKARYIQVRKRKQHNTLAAGKK